MIEFLCCYKRVRLKKAVVFKEKSLIWVNVVTTYTAIVLVKFLILDDYKKVYKKQKHCALPVLIDTSVL